MLRLIGFLLLFTYNAVWATADINKARAWSSPEKMRLVFESNAELSYKVFQLRKPERLVIDLNNASIEKKILSTLEKNELISSTRVSSSLNPQSKVKDLRLVLELKKSVSIKDFTLKPNLDYQHRLVIDLFQLKTAKSSIKLNNVEVSKTKSNSAIRNNSTKTKPLTSKQQVTKSVRQLPQRDLIVAIDAGHGGEDPGAIGRRKTQEKKVVLEIAKRLAKLVNKQAGMQAVLIRSGDYYVSLRERTSKARAAHADVFVSIHADAFKNTKARGSSVFILSERGASSESARWLAAKENSADLAGGVSLDDKDDMLVKVLLDLSQTATIEGSVSVAQRVLQGLKKIGKTHSKKVERAGFVVLKSPDIPSILVETGFISNPYEEKMLSTASYQYKLAKAVFEGVDLYFKRFPIPGTIYGLKLSSRDVKGNNRKTPAHSYQNVISNNRYHIVKRGDSLSKLSKQYHVSIRQLKSANRLYSDKLYLGKKLIIP